MNPLISVIVPVYNREDYILECLESVYNQKYRPIEVVIVDDGSTDNSISKVIDYKKSLKVKKNFTISVYNCKNRGATKARNYGLKKSKGEYIQWLDSDDLLLPDKLSSQIYAFKNNIDVVYSKAQFFDSIPSNLMNQFWGRKPQNNSSDYFEFPWQTMCALYKKSAIEKYGAWDEEFSLSDDWELSIRYTIMAKVKFLDKVSSLYRDHKGERIGNNLNTSKVKSLSSILIKTYNLSLNHNLIDDYLIKRYQSRLLYCIIQFGALGASAEKKELIKIIKDNKLIDFKIQFFSFINLKFINKLILNSVT